MHGKLINNRADRLCFCRVGPTFQECSISEFLKAASLVSQLGEPCSFGLLFCFVKYRLSNQQCAKKTIHIAFATCTSMFLST